MRSLLHLNYSRVVAALVLAGIFLLMLFCCRETNLVADDYRYCFSFADDSRIESVAQILPSMAAHRLTMNGRVIPHFLVQLFLMLPKTAFDAVNALFFTALVWLICFLAVGDGRPNALLLFSVFACLWCLQPDFGQVFLWLDGSINYLWCAVLCLVWLLPWTEHCLLGWSPEWPWQLLLVLFSFPVGAWSENGTVALAAMALCFLLIDCLENRHVPPLWMFLSLAALLLGFLYMMLAPAESVNKAAEMRLPVLFANFLETGRFYLRFWPLFLSFLLFWILSYQGERAHRDHILSLVLLIGSLSGHFVLTFAMYTAPRSTYIGLVLLLCANAVLFAPLFGTGRRMLIAGVGALCLAFTAWLVPVGVEDIMHTHEQLQFNEELIVQCAANGERVVHVPRPYPETSYSAMAGLNYLNVEDPDDWPNVYMAKYFGVDGIIAYH